MKFQHQLTLCLTFAMALQSVAFSGDSGTSGASCASGVCNATTSERSPAKSSTAHQTFSKLKWGRPDQPATDEKLIQFDQPQHTWPRLDAKRPVVVPVQVKSASSSKIRQVQAEFEIDQPPRPWQGYWQNRFQQVPAGPRAEAQLEDVEFGDPQDPAVATPAVPQVQRQRTSPRATPRVATQPRVRPNPSATTGSTPQPSAARNVTTTPIERETRQPVYVAQSDARAKAKTIPPIKVTVPPASRTRRRSRAFQSLLGELEDELKAAEEATETAKTQQESLKETRERVRRDLNRILGDDDEGGEAADGKSATKGPGGIDLGDDDDDKQEENPYVDPGYVEPKPEPIYSHSNRRQPYAYTLRDILQDDEDDPCLAARERAFCNAMWNCAGGKCQSPWQRLQRSWERDNALRNAGCNGGRLCGIDSYYREPPCNSGGNCVPGVMSSLLPSSQPGAMPADAQVDTLPAGEMFQPENLIMKNGEHPPVNGKLAGDSDTGLPGKVKRVNFEGVYQQSVELIRGEGVCTGACGGKCEIGCRVLKDIRKYEE